MLLETRRLYKLKCRNLSCGVFNGAGAFIGIRTKFDSTFLASEYVSEFVSTVYGDFAPHGTVMAAEPLDAFLPVGIPLGEVLGTHDQLTGRRVEFDRPLTDGGKGWYFKDSGESCGSNVRPSTIPNRDFFKWLKENGLESPK